jgi:uncharacterized membrane protein
MNPAAVLASAVFNSAMSQVNVVWGSMVAAFGSWQLLVAIVVLIVLVFTFLFSLADRNRRYDELLEQKQQQEDAARRLEDEKEQVVADTRTSANRAIQARDKQIDQLTDRLNELSKFRDEYRTIPDARAEANRILREAKEHAYVVSNRTEMEYAEIIEHANREAEAIRTLAQQRLARSHEALKAALARANEIVEEAHLAASRVERNGVTYMAAPGLIEAPADTDMPADPTPVEIDRHSDPYDRD